MELVTIDAGGTGLAILAGTATALATVVVVATAPPGTKTWAATKVITSGIILTGGAYYL